jgi:hypothetical protein
MIALVSRVYSTTGEVVEAPAPILFALLLAPQVGHQGGFAISSEYCVVSSGAPLPSSAGAFWYATNVAQRVWQEMHDRENCQRRKALSTPRPA